MMACAPIAAFLSRRIDPRAMLGFGLCDFALGLWLLTSIDSRWTGCELFWPLVIRGSALMFCVVPTTIMALGTLPPTELKMASALFNTVRNLGGAVGIASVNTMLNDRTNLHWFRLAERLTVGRPQVMVWMNHLSERIARNVADPTAPDSSSSGGILANLIWREAASMAYADAFLMMAVVFVVSRLLVPFMERMRPAFDA